MRRCRHGSWKPKADYKSADPWGQGITSRGIQHNQLRPQEAAEERLLNNLTHFKAMYTRLGPCVKSTHTGSRKTNAQKRPEKILSLHMALISEGLPPAWSQCAKTGRDPYFILYRIFNERSYAYKETREYGSFKGKTKHKHTWTNRLKTY